MENFSREDVEHLDMVIADMISNTPGLVSLPGAAAARNKIAVRVGLPVAEEGNITWEHVQETSYADEAPASD